MNSKNTGIAFISGAGLKPWIWKSVRKELTDIPTIAVDFGAKRSQNSLEDYVTTALDQLSEMKIDNWVVVAHSAGGIVGLELSKQLGSKCKGFVGVSAAVPSLGKNFVSILPIPMRIIMPIILKKSGTKPPDSNIRESLCSGLDESTTGKVVKDFVDESVELFLEPTSAAELPTMPALYVVTKNDKEFSVDLQKKMSKRLPGGETRVIMSGHLPMISHPKELVAIINDFYISLD